MPNTVNTIPTIWGLAEDFTAASVNVTSPSALRMEPAAKTGRE
jgi:hypothetical protein